ncbi:helix-turn-helix transcriptional regulator [Gordonia shandongensis]|uniref:helix-turn-helix transcriptional regulator n=1 Tax=Gordonia shandongensis TaxID=376351 RepID=UPI0003FCC5E8|nr:WYL domain-containing protein [Gordonia shandongensis]
MTSATAPSRLSRLLAMVPYFQARPGIKLATAADDLGVSVPQLTADLEQLFVCGLPGYGPEDLIDIQFWDGYVSVLFTAGMDRPLRLTGTEANIVLMALNMVSDTPGAADPAAVRSAIAKIEAAVGAAGRAVATDVADVGERPVDQSLRTAMETRRAVRIRYYTPSRDSVSERTVDPIRITAVDGNSYLEAWCRSSEGVRLFRFDRVESADVLDEESAPPTTVGPLEPPTDVRALTGELPVARIQIDPESIWLLEYYAADPESELDEAPDVPIAATLRYGSPEWLTRFLLGFGGRVRLLSAPDDIAADLGRTAQSARARYRR